MAGIYLHIPFCKQACYYCDFHFSTSLKKKEPLVKSLALELLLRKSELEGQTVETIYFGGGTPSLLTIDEIRFLLQVIDDNFSIVQHPEITLEANPDDLSKQQIMDLSKTSINRLSIGIQSFFEDDLKNMNRAHSAMEAKYCLEEATQAFNDITIDLIYGIPTMSLAKWNENLKMAFDFKVNHISAYALTVEPKTALDSFIRKGKFPPVDEQLALAHFQQLMEETKQQGFIQYEISNFGKPNHFSRHNTSYWQGKPYLGIGPSAHSYNGLERSWNVSNNSQYIKSIQQGVLPATSEKLTLNDRYNEYVMTGLRTIWGVSLNRVEKDFGMDHRAYLLEQVKPFLDREQLTLYEGTIKTVDNAKFLCDGIAAELFMI